MITNREFMETKEFKDLVNNFLFPIHESVIHEIRGNKTQKSGLSYKRQASKFRNKKGFLFKNKSEVINEN